MSSWYTWLFAGGPHSVLSLLLVWAVSRDVGIGVKLQGVQTAMCFRWAAPGKDISLQILTQDGDIAIGGLFNLHDMHPAIESFTKSPLYKPCTGVSLKLASYMYAMVFTVEDMNCNTMLLLAVRLSIVDICGGSWAALQRVLLLAGGDKSNSTAPVPPSAVSKQMGSKQGGNSVPLVTGDVSSSTSVIRSLTSSPLSKPVVPTSTSVCIESCPPGTGVARRKREPACCFDCISEGEVSNMTGSVHCEHCPLEFWPNPEPKSSILHQVDFLSFNETLGITLTAAAAAGAVVTTAVSVVFLYHCHTPLVRANSSELSFPFLLSLKLCFLCSLVFIGRPSVWSCRFQQAAFGITFVLSVSCLLVKTIVVLVAFRSTRPGAGDVMKWFGPDQQRGSVCLFTSIQVITYIAWLSISPPVPQHGLGVKGSKLNPECAIRSALGFALVLGCIGLLARWPSYVYCWCSTFSILIFCAVWMAFAYVSSPGKYSVAVEMVAILASSYGLLVCIFTPKCFIILLRPERNTKKHLLAR